MIESLDYVEDLPSRPIEIETVPETTQIVRTSEERVVVSQPEEIIQSSSLRSSARSSMRTIGVEHSIKMRNAQRTEHIERTVVSN